MTSTTREIALAIIILEYVGLLWYAFATLRWYKNSQKTADDKRKVNLRLGFACVFGFVVLFACQLVLRHKP